MRGRNFFIINEKSSHKNIKYASHLLPYKLSRKFISWASTKTKTPSFFAVPTIVDTAMKALLLLMRYAFNQDGLDLDIVLNISY